MSKGWAGHGQLSTTCRHQEMEDGQERPQGAGRIEGQPHPPRPTALWHGLLALPEMPASAMPVCPADHPGHKPSVPMNWGDHSQNTELSVQAEKKLPKNIAKRTGTTGHSRNRPLSLSHRHKPQEQSATGSRPRTTCRSSRAALGQLGFGSPTRERGITGPWNWPGHPGDRGMEGHSRLPHRPPQLPELRCTPAATGTSSGEGQAPCSFPSAEQVPPGPTCGSPASCGEWHQGNVVTGHHAGELSSWSREHAATTGPG